jgi:hypothetical protein
MGGGGETSSTVESDPWANMPSWLKDRYKDDVKFRDKLLDQGQDVAKILGKDPREIMMPGENEQQALERILAGGEAGQGLLDQAAGNLGGGYEDKYTDDVVDTTLAGMQRQAQREALAREGRAAAVGGTSNTRAAVGQAVADQLTGMNMGEMEAKLRSDALRFGTDANFEETRQLADLAGLNTDLGLKIGGAQGLYGEKERELLQQQEDEERNAKKDSLSWLGGLFQGTQGSQAPTSSTQTSTQPKPSTFSQILGAGATVAGAFLSDERSKEKILPMSVGLDALKDVTPRTYDYKEGMPTDLKGRQAGLIAQELEHIPGAVRNRRDGLKEVNPYPVLATVVQAVKELDVRTRSH